MAESPKPYANSLRSRIDAAGIADGVFTLLEQGGTLQSARDLCARHGIETSLASVHGLKRGYLSAWQSAKVMAEAERENLPAQDLQEAVRLMLLSRIGRAVTDVSGLDQLKTVVSVFSDWNRASVAERAEARQERESLRRFAAKVDDLLGDPEILESVRAARNAAAEGGLEARLAAISSALWGMDLLNP